MEKEITQEGLNLNMYNFKLVCADTDSFTICKPTGEQFSNIEIDLLTNQLNALYPEHIDWEFEFNSPKMIVLKAKNYIIVDSNGKKKIKGSALKSSTLEPKIKQMIQDMLDMLLEDKQKEMVNIYHEHIRTIRDGITDIKPWAKKLTLSPKTFDSERLNETKIVEAIKGTEYKSGDRIYIYTTSENTLKLAEKFEGDYDIDTYIQKLFKATMRFETVLPVKELFLNYSLKKNKKLLECL